LAWSGSVRWFRPIRSVFGPEARALALAELRPAGPAVAGQGYIRILFPPLNRFDFRPFLFWPSAASHRFFGQPPVLRPTSGRPAAFRASPRSATKTAVRAASGQSPRPGRYTSQLWRPQATPGTAIRHHSGESQRFSEEHTVRKASTAEEDFHGRKPATPDIQRNLYTQ